MNDVFLTKLVIKIDDREPSPFTGEFQRESSPAHDLHTFAIPMVPMIHKWSHLLPDFHRYNATYRCITNTVSEHNQDTYATTDHVRSIWTLPKQTLFARGSDFISKWESKTDVLTRKAHTIKIFNTNYAIRAYAMSSIP